MQTLHGHAIGLKCFRFVTNDEIEWSALFAISNECQITESKYLKDTHRKIATSEKTPAFTKSMNMYIWIVGTLNQLFIRNSKTETKFPKHKIVIYKPLFFVIILRHNSVCLNIVFWYGSAVWKWCISNLSAFNQKNGTPVFWKWLVPFFRRAYALSFGFKMKRLTKIVLQC